MNQPNHNIKKSESKLRLTNRGKVAATMAGLIALAGTYKVGEAVVHHANEQKQEMNLLAKVPSLDEPHKLLVLKANDTANAIVRKAFPEDLSDPGRFYKRVQLVEGQGLGEDQTLMQGQSILLPEDAKIGQAVNPAEKQDSP